MRVWLPADPSRRVLVIGAVCSVVLHLLLAGALYLSGGFASPVMSKRGEPLFVDIAPDKPQERAPLGNPSRPVGPDQPAPERPPRAAPPPSKAPQVASRPAPTPAPRAPAPRPAETQPSPAPPAPAATPAAPAPPEPAGATPRTAEPAPPPPTPEPARAEPQAPPPGRRAEPGDARFALSKPSLDTPSIFRRPGGGGGLKGGGRGGVEGEPIPLDTPDPKYQDYFNQIRERIKAKWIYPREAGDRGIGGQLLIEFHIAKDGKLSMVELRRSSGTEILDDYALRAIQLAQPFPPVPDAIAKQVLAISGMFTYQIVGNSFVNQYLR
jgi:periplasmic protein TonB